MTTTIRAPLACLLTAIFLTAGAATAAPPPCSVQVSGLIGHDARGCYVDLTCKPSWTLNPNDCAGSVPFGIEFAPTNSVKIVGIGTFSGTWLYGATYTKIGTTGNYTAIRWTKPPGSPCNTANAVTSGQTIKVRVYLNIGSASSWALNVSLLNGTLSPLCQASILLQKPLKNYSLSSAPGLVCSGDVAKLTLSPPPPDGSVTWYFRPGAGCTAPLTLPGPGWTALGPLPNPVSSNGGITWNTNEVNTPTCYVAVIRQGCFEYISSVATVKTCPKLTSVAWKPPAPNNLTMIDGQYHACGSWSGTLELSNVDPATCPTTVVWTRNGVTIPAKPGVPYAVLTGALTNTGSGAVCPSVSYVFKAVITNVCGTIERTVTIVVDRAPVPGTLTAVPSVPPTSPTPYLCYGGSALITLAGECGTVQRWEQSPYNEITKTCGAWTPIPASAGPGPGSTKVYQTRKLYASTCFRVLVKNGACTGVPSAPVTILVKPNLTGTIAAVGGKVILCPPPVTLNATTTYDPGGFPKTFAWFKDRYDNQVGSGVAALGVTSVPPFGPGNYWCVVTDANGCGFARTNAITVCGKPSVSISGPCATCNGKKSVLTASAWSPCGGVTYQWHDAGGNVVGTGQTCTVVGPGTFTVTITSTALAGCTATSAPFVLGLCP